MSDRLLGNSLNSTTPPRQKSGSLKLHVLGCIATVLIFGLSGALAYIIWHQSETTTSAYAEYLDSRLKDFVAVGHLSPDTDIYCSAYGIAELFGGKHSYPAGPVSEEVRWVAERWGLPADPDRFEELYLDSDTPVILVDHNQMDQSPLPEDQMDARLMAVFDHHNLQSRTVTSTTIVEMLVAQVGCTCSLVAEMYLLLDRVPSEGAAGCLLSGILSDTLVFRSVTATDFDIEMADRLAWWAGVSDVTSYGRQVILSGDQLSNQTAEEVFASDAKTYEMTWADGTPCLVRWATVEGPGVHPDAETNAEYVRVMQAFKQENDFCLVFMTWVDVLDEHTILTMPSELELAIALDAYHDPGAFEISSNKVDFANRMSRKSQFIPPLQLYLSNNNPTTVVSVSLGL